MRKFYLISISFFLFITAGFAKETPADPYLWLEEINGERALAWAKEKNNISTKQLEASPHFQSIYDRSLEISNSKDLIPSILKRDKYFYNFHRDEKYPRGVWRRNLAERYGEKNVDWQKLMDLREIMQNWETVIDLDQLAKDENENWVWRGANCLYPKYEKCLIMLSRGGADATVTREFDTVSKTFVKDGFAIPEAKGSISWRDENTVYAVTDFGPGTMTTSGYPRQVKEWRRGTPLSDAKLIFEGTATDIRVGAAVAFDPKYQREYVSRFINSFNIEQYLRQGDKLIKLDVPPDARAFGFRDLLIVNLRSEWKIGDKVYPQGAALAIDFDGFLGGARNFDILFQPSERKSLAGITPTKNYLLINELDNVRNRIYQLHKENGQWIRHEVDAPAYSTLGVTALDAEQSDEYFLTVTDFLTPSTVYFRQAGTKKNQKVKNLPAFFDAKGLVVKQHEATSKDGTRIPYFVVIAENAKLDGKNPTLLYGYGGFQVSQVPGYSATVGHAWLNRGGVYVVANLRGGGEFGPRWHQAALKEKRQKAFDDFIAVAEDLIARKITTPRHLAINGGSNGGLLVAAVMLQRPELFRAVVCSVPLLDMQRYHKLLAGASWMSEYGNPDEANDWNIIKTYSPYQNVVKEKKYPKVFFNTSTRDDRVHPGHARKMVAKMLEQNHDVLYYENIEGGHGAAANNKQQAYRSALIYSFLLQELR